MYKANRICEINDPYATPELTLRVLLPLIEKLYELYNSFTMFIQLSETPVLLRRSNKIV